MNDGTFKWYKLDAIASKKKKENSVYKENEALPFPHYIEFYY